MEEAKVLLKIIKNFLEDTKSPETKGISEEKLYKLAKKHKVENFLKNWAETNSKVETIKKLIITSYYTQIIKDTNENIELEHILNKLEEEKIDTFIIKGTTMKEIYPQDYMRQMCDIDMLVHSRDFKKTTNCIEKLGFNKFYDYEKHLVFEKKPFILVELHRRLLSGEDVCANYFNHIWSSGISYKNYHHIYRMDIEDTYIFCIIHLLHHFRSTGIKIRDILDVYLLHEKYKNVFNYEKLEEKFQKFKVKDFEEKIKKIAYKWFDTENLDEFDEIETFILQGEMSENKINYEVGKNQGKINYIVKMFFPPLKRMQERYPILKKSPILLPIMWLIRFFKKIFSKETTIKERIHKIKLIQKTKQEGVTQIQEIHKKLGI